MAFVLNDRVKESSTDTGTGSFDLAGAVSGFETFVTGIGGTNTTYYAIVHQTADEWEVGVTTVTDASTDTISRSDANVFSSTNSDNRVDFAAGTKHVFCTLPASKAVVEDDNADVTLPDDLILDSDSAVLKFGDDQDTTLTHTDGTGLTLNSTNKLTFQDTGTYVYSSTDGQLDLVADTEIQIAATTIDINGAADISGNLDVGGTLGVTGVATFATHVALGDSDQLKLGGSTDLQIYHDGTNSYVANKTGALKIATETSGIAVTIGHTTSETTIADNATITGNLSVGGNFDVTGTLDFSDSAITNAGDIQLDSITGDSDTNTNITFSGSDIITIATGGSNRLTIKDGALSPVTDDQIDLGTTTLEFKNAYFDGTVTSDAFAGPLTGDVTGNVSGTAATVTTAAQTNITSVGDLTALVVDDVAIDGKVITMTGSSSDTAVLTAGTNGTLSIVTTDAAAAAANIQITADGTVDIDSAGVLTLDSGAAINIEPASGSAILLDGTISVDAGVVTGATSITSTAFVGTLSTAAQANVTSLGTLTTLTVDNVIINGTTIGHTSDTDLITLASGAVTIAGDLTISGDDITMGTNTDTAIMVADGTNYNPVVPSGDIGVTNAGVFSIASGVIVNADINASAAIADSKLATISTANKVDIGALDIDGASEIGAALVDADIIIVDDGAGGTEKKALMSRVKTYVEDNATLASPGFSVAMAIAL